MKAKILWGEETVDLIILMQVPFMSCFFCALFVEGMRGP